MKAGSKGVNGGTNRVMYYHADASPMGGHLTHPKELVLSAKGSVSLGQAGGHAASKVKNFRPHPEVSTGTAYSVAKGGVNAETGNWTTVVTSTVEDLKLFDVVTADRIVANLSIEHPRRGDYPCVCFDGCVFENLRIAGKPVTLDLDLALLTAKQHDFPDVPWPEVPGFVKRAVAQNAKIVRDAEAPAPLRSRYAWMSQKSQRTQKGYIACSLVAGVQGTVPGSTFGHVVRVPGFGDLFLGELIVDARSFHLNMLRAEMGGNGNNSPANGSTAKSGKTPRGAVNGGKANGKVALQARAGDDPPTAPVGNFSFASTRGNGLPSP